MHYRIRIYNAFYEMFQEEGYEFHVLSNEFQTVDVAIKFKKHVLPFNPGKYATFIRDLNPVLCINFLHLRDHLILPLTFFCKRNNIPMVYWGHGINIKTPNAFIKNLYFHLIHSLSSALIIYSDKQLEYIWKIHRAKTFIAKNTLDFSQVDMTTLKSPNEVKELYGIKERFVLMYISRILPYKGLDILLSLFTDDVDIALVIVGGGLSSEQRKKIELHDNYYYLGEKYGKDVDEIYNMGDVFSTPGHIGLAVNQSMYWGKPIVVLNRIHAPEIIYVHNGLNSFIVESPEDLHDKVLELKNDTSLYKKISEAARRTFEEEMDIRQMFQGFMQAINYCLQR